MNTYYFFTFPEYDRPHGDLAFICRGTAGDDPVGTVKYQARRTEKTVELIAVQAESCINAYEIFDGGGGEVVLRVKAETTYNIEDLRKGETV